MGVALEVETAVQELPHLFLAHQSPMHAMAVVVLRLDQPVLEELVGVAALLAQVVAVVRVDLEPAQDYLLLQGLTTRLL